MRFGWLFLVALSGCPAGSDEAPPQPVDAAARITTRAPEPPARAEPEPLAATGPLTPEAQEREELLFTGRLRLAERDYLGALARFEEVIGRWGAHPDGYSHRAAVRASRGEFAAALEDYDRALELIPAGDPRRELTQRHRTNVAESAAQARATGDDERSWRR